MATIRLFDDGRKTYQALNAFEWAGPVTKTPFGTAAFLGDGTPSEPATGRVGGFFGTANGRTWDQQAPLKIVAAPTGEWAVRFDINSEDIIAVYDNLGGGFVACGRHDEITGTVEKPACMFGTVHKRRISNGEAKRVAMICVPDDRSSVVIKHTVMTWDYANDRSWMSEYTGDSNFTYTTETISGNRSTLGIGGVYLQGIGWTLENNDTAVFTIERETISDNLGVFVTRTTPIRREVLS